MKTKAGTGKAVPVQALLVCLLRDEPSGQTLVLLWGSAFFTDGPNTGSIGSAAAGAGAGGVFGLYAPGFVNSVTGKEFPGFIFDATGAFGSEFLGGYIKELLNTSNDQNTSEKEMGGKK